MIMSMVLTAFLLSNCSQAQKAKTQGKYVSVSSPEFKVQIKKQTHEIILDVRTSAEVAKGKIAGAINIDYYKADFYKKVAKLDHNRPILIYCAAGVRSLWAMRKMKRMGFKKIVNLKRGFDNWRKMGFAITK